MNRSDAPFGTIRYRELLNALLAIWKTKYSVGSSYYEGDLDDAYHLGFEDGLDAIAQSAGLTDAFEAGKAAHRAKIEQKLSTKAKLIGPGPFQQS